MPSRIRALALLALAVILAGSSLTGCAAIPDPAARRQAALATATAHGLVSLPPSGGELPVLALGRDGPGEDLVVYLEGDGLAFLDRATPSPDPTPVTPLALRLAVLEPGPQGRLPGPALPVRRPPAPGLPGGPVDRGPASAPRP